MRAALPDGRRGTIAVSAVEKLADFERREESERRSDPAAFMKALSGDGGAGGRLGRHADGGSFLRSVFLARDLIVQRDPDMLLAAYPKADGGRSLGQVQSRRRAPSSGLSTGVRAAGISLGGSSFVSAPDMGGDLQGRRAGRAQRFPSRSKAPCASIRASSTIPASLPPARTPTGRPRQGPRMPCSRRADIEMMIR